MRLYIDVPRFNLKTVMTAFIVLLGTTAAMSGDSEIDMDSVMHSIGRFGTAHSCPIGPSIAITAAHVIDPRWYDPDFKLMPLRFSNDAGDIGVLMPAGVHSETDIGWMRISSRNEVKYYEIAEHGPSIEDKVYWIEYNFKKSRDAFRTERREAKVTRIVAGHIFTEDAPTGGASGGCVFNESGKVIAIVSAGWSIGFTHEPNVGMFVSIYGPWKPKPPESLRTEEDIV